MMRKRNAWIVLLTVCALCLSLSAFAPASAAEDEVNRYYYDSAPVFSLAAGTYMGPQEVEITCPLEGAQIYYTLDGSVPTEQSSLYEGPVTVGQPDEHKAWLFRAVGFKDGKFTDVTTVQYNIDKNYDIAQDAELTLSEYVDAGNNYRGPGEGNVLPFLNSLHNGVYSGEATFITGEEGGPRPYYQLDFGEVKSFGFIGVSGYHDWNVYYDVVLSVSDDGETFTPFYENAAVTAPGPIWQTGWGVFGYHYPLEITLDEPVSGRYVRIQFKQLHEGNTVCLSGVIIRSTDYTDVFETPDQQHYLTVDETIREVSVDRDLSAEEVQAAIAEQLGAEFTFLDETGAGHSFPVTFEADPDYDGYYGGVFYFYGRVPSELLTEDLIDLYDTAIVVRVNVATRPDPTLLNEWIGKIDGQDYSAYTQKSTAVLNQALTEAKEISALIEADPDNADVLQSEIDAAAEALKSAYENLALKADKTELNQLIAQAKELKEEDYLAAGYQALQEKIAAAETAAADEDLSQADADAAVSALRAAMEALKEVADLEELNRILTEVGALNEADYLKAGFEALQEIAAEAEALIESGEVSQADADAMVGKLNDAIEALVRLGDRAALTEAVEKAQAYVGENYTQSSFAVLEDLITEALALLEKEEIAEPETVEMISALEAAELALVDVTALNELIAEAEQIEIGDYTFASTEGFAEALAAAQSVRTLFEATAENVAEAQAALQAALDSLVKKGDKTALNELIASEVGDSSEYTPVSWLGYMVALDNARKVAAWPEADEQSVLEAEQMLRTALEGLTAQVNKAALQQAIFEAEALEEKNYSESSWKALQSALEEARKVMDGLATQAEADQAAAGLKEALNAMEEIATGGGCRGGEASAALLAVIGAAVVVILKKVR